MPLQSFPVGRQDTAHRVQSVRQARRTFFFQLTQIAPESLADLRALPPQKHEGEILNRAEVRLPRWTGGRWIDLRRIAVPDDVADRLERHPAEGFPMTPGELSKQRDAALYRDWADDLFVPETIVRWTQKWHVSAEWLAAFGILVRARRRQVPNQPLRRVLATLHGFPRVHPWSETEPLVTETDRLVEYPTMRAADPRVETAREFVAYAKEHYRRCQTHLDNLGLIKIRSVDLNRNCKWLVQSQVLGQTFASIASGAGVKRQAVDAASRGLAKQVGLTLRSSRAERSGRPRGRRESGRRRAQR